MPDRAHAPPNQRRVTDTDSDSKSSTTDTAHTSHRKRLDSTHKKHPLGKHTTVKPRMGPRSSSSRQVTTLKSGGDKEEGAKRRYSAEMAGDGEVSPRNTGSHIVGRKEGKKATPGSEGEGAAAGSKGEWDDVVDLEGIKQKALEREASVMSLQGLNLAQRQKSQSGMRRNRSAAEMAKRRLLLGQEKHTLLKKSASHTSVNKAAAAGQGRTSVHFDLGHQRDQGGEDEEEEEEVDDDGWTEASGSASPNLSRSGSVAGQSSGRNSARGQSKAGSEAPSMATSPERSRMGTESRDWSENATASSSRRESHSQNGSAAAAAQARHPDATQITTRLLQRVASHSAAPQMSAVSATALTPSSSSLGNGQHKGSQPTSEAGHSSGTATPHDLPAELISRFKGSGPGTPGDSSSPFHSNLASNPNNPTTKTPSAAQPSKSNTLDTNRRAKSMSNLTHQTVDSDSDDRPLAPRSRKSSTAAYAPPPQSRTQQKLWLQRASSNIESAAPSTSSLGLNLALNGLGGASVLDGDSLNGDANPLARTLVGSIGFREGEGSLGMGVRDGRGGDPRVRIVLERGGMAYRAVGRFVDPVVRSLRRLENIPGAHRGATRIPAAKPKSSSASVRAGKETRESAGAKGLSQSLKDARGGGGGFLERAKGRSSVDVAAKGAGAGSGQPRSFDGREGGSLGSAAGEGEGDEEVRMLLRGLWESRGERTVRVRRGEEGEE